MMDTCFIVGIIRGLILLAIGSAGLINIDYIANIYVPIIIIVLGLLTFTASYNQ